MTRNTVLSKIVLEKYYTNGLLKHFNVQKNLNLEKGELDFQYYHIKIFQCTFFNNKNHKGIERIRKVLPIHRKEMH